jgi:signal peptidase I
MAVAATLAVIHFLVPTRMAGGASGWWAWIARVGDEHPLPLGLALFLLFSATAKYWRRHLVRGEVSTARAESDADARRAARRRLRFAVLLGAVALGALGLRGRVVELYRVISPSMVPTLNVGDRLVVNRLAYGLRLPFSERILRARAPRRGDVIVFPSEAAGGDGTGPMALVKRVIGLPGDVVAFRNGVPFVNGWVVPSCDAGPFVSTAGTITVRGRLAVELLEDSTYLTVRMPLDETQLDDYRVPPGEVFVMGDDRGQSNDSRAWNNGHGGSVPIRSIIGRVSRLAVGAFRDGRLDLGQLFAPLGHRVREPRVDLSKTQEHIARCLASPRPPSTSPPSPAPPAAPVPAGGAK